MNKEINIDNQEVNCGTILVNQNQPLLIEKLTSQSN